MDGSQKLPQRLLGTIRERLHLGLPIQALALAVAAWIAYVGGVDERGAPIDVRDPLAAELRRHASGQNPVANILAMPEVVVPALARDRVFLAAVTDAYRRLRAQGARGAAAA